MINIRVCPRYAFALACLVAAGVIALHAAAATATPPRGAGHPGASEHGRLLFSERIRSPVPGARMWWILYLSEDQHGAPTPVSGTVLVPKRKPPRGGWPIISWAHGTTGIASICAPSLGASAPASPIQQEVDRWATLGYAVAQTDYVGLGIPSVEHPYLDGTVEGQNVIDIVRAARQVDPALSTEWLAAGHSQGGQAALFAGAEAKRWAPELRLRGVAAFAPASHIAQQAEAIDALTQPGPLTGYAALILDGAAASSSAVELSSIESPQALQLRPLIDQECLAELEKPNAYGVLAPIDLIRPGADLAPLLRVLHRENPALTMSAPIRLFQGDADTTVPEPLTAELTQELQAKGDSVGYTTFPGVSHVGVVAAAEQLALKWFAKRLSRRRTNHPRGMGPPGAAIVQGHDARSYPVISAGDRGPHN
jgi:predicted esterase